MFLFLVLTGLIAAIINKQILTNFDNNRPLNALIIGVLIFGIDARVDKETEVDAACGFKLARGRFFTPAERGQRVMVLGHAVSAELQSSFLILMVLCTDFTPSVSPAMDTALSIAAWLLA